jgi:hypothetical protein
LTLIIIPYTFIAPRKLPSFYHVYAEIILEFFLCFFWLVSFASLGSSVSSTEVGLSSAATIDSVLGIPSYNGDNAQLNSLLNNIYKALACFKAVAVFGALML